MVQEGGGSCAELKAEIDRKQSEVEQMWLSISTGGGDKARYRNLRDEVAQLRVRYRQECGELTESSSLPRSITADWHSG